MQRIRISDLQVQDALPWPVLHESGMVLRQAGDPMTSEMLEKLRSLDVIEVVIPEKGEGLERVKRLLVYAQMPLDDVSAGMILSQPIYAENGALLLNANTAIPKSFNDSMRSRNITMLYLPKSPEDRKVEQGTTASAAITDLDPRNKRPIDHLMDKKVYDELKSIDFQDAVAADLDSQKLRSKINAFKKIEILPDGEAFSTKIEQRDRFQGATEAEKSAFSDVVKDSRTILAEVFEDILKGNKRIDHQSLDEVATHSMGGVIRNRDLMMLCSTQTGSQEYLINHALAMAVVALNIASEMGFTAEQVKTLSYGALLADVGMFMIAGDIREKPEGLSNRERAEVMRHPAIGLDLLQRVTRIPRDVPYIVYQSHERNNGSGYPCGKKSVVIHMFARIVAVSDAYTALVADRPYRDAATPYQAMASMLKMCSGKLFDQAVVRSLLECNALCPVGSFIRLSDGSLGRVVSANREDFMRPIVAVLASAEGQVHKPPKRVSLLDAKELSIKQVIDPREKGLRIDQFAGF